MNYAKAPGDEPGVFVVRKLVNEFWKLEQISVDFVYTNCYHIDTSDSKGEMKMKNTHVGKTVTIKQGNLSGQTGVVTYQRNDGAVMVKVNGTDEGYAPEMVGLPRIDAIAPAWIVELAYKYNVSTDTIREENMNFLQSEGYFETAREVIECHTFETWLKLAVAKLAYRIEEPYQKSDLGYGL